MAYGTQHGVYDRDPSSKLLRRILYREDESALQAAMRPDGTVPVITGIVFFTTRMTESLLTLQVKPPLDACTYLGLDNGEASWRRLRETLT